MYPVCRLNFFIIYLVIEKQMKTKGDLFLIPKS